MKRISTLKGTHVITPPYVEGIQKSFWTEIVCVVIPLIYNVSNWCHIHLHPLQTWFSGSERHSCSHGSVIHTFTNKYVHSHLTCVESQCNVALTLGPLQAVTNRSICFLYQITLQLKQARWVWGYRRPVCEVQYRGASWTWWNSWLCLWGDNYYWCYWTDKQTWRRHTCTRTMSISEARGSSQTGTPKETNQHIWEKKKKRRS